MTRKNELTVCSHNEWDTLEEVIVGSVKGAFDSPHETLLDAYYPSDLRDYSGKSYNREELNKAQEQLDGLSLLLTKEGVKVRRPEAIDFSAPAKTPYFTVNGGNCAACPRDVFLVLGNTILEASMALRSRYFEFYAYRNLLMEYFKQGADWRICPKPTMSDGFYSEDFSAVGGIYNCDSNPPFSKDAIVFDAASFVRMGEDIFYQPDMVTNELAANWISRQVNGPYKFHKILFEDKHPPMHLDTTLVPLCEGLVLTNPERPMEDSFRQFFRRNKWEVIDAPPSVHGVEFHSPEISNWISMNVLSISEEKVVVEESEEQMIRFLEELGFSVLTCKFNDVYKFGGGFHCCTVDIRRRGALKNYFGR